MACRNITLLLLGRNYALNELGTMNIEMAGGVGVGVGVLQKEFWVTISAVFVSFC